MGPGVYHFLFLCAIIPVYDSRLIPGDSAMKDNIPENDDQSAVLLPDSEPSENAEENAAVPAEENAEENAVVPAEENTAVSEVPPADLKREKRQQRALRIKSFLQDESVQQVGRILGAGMIQIGGSIAYEKLFSRYERPDYAVTPGLRCYDRIAERLPRKCFSFPSDNISCAGYYYPAESPKGLIAFAHGLHTGADDYLSIFEFFVRHGYSIIAFDGKGTYDSKGNSTVGLSEALVELDHLIDLIEEDPAFNALPLFTVGHSCGGFAASAVLSLHPNIRAAMTISAMNDANTLITGKGFIYTSILGLPETKMTSAFLNETQKNLFGSYTELNGAAAINSVSCPVLIAHGIKDMVVEYPSPVSLIFHKNEIRSENVTYYTGTGNRGSHDTVWRSSEAVDYQEQVKKELELLRKKKGKSFTPEDEAAFVSGIDHDLYSAINTELFEMAVRMFDQACTD